MGESFPAGLTHFSDVFGQVVQANVHFEDLLADITRQFGSVHPMPRVVQVVPPRLEEGVAVFHLRHDMMDDGIGACLQEQPIDVHGRVVEVEQIAHLRDNRFEHQPVVHNLFVRNDRGLDLHNRLRTTLRTGEHPLYPTRLDRGGFRCRVGLQHNRFLESPGKYPVGRMEHPIVHLDFQ